MTPGWLSYRVDIRKIGAQSLSLIMDAPRMGVIVDAFLPTHPVNAHELRHIAADEVPLISDEELKETAGLMKGGKSPGPDGVHSDVVKVIAAYGYSLIRIAAA